VTRITKAAPEQLELDPSIFQDASLDLPGSMTFAQWESVGKRLQRFGRSINWWVGDWLALGDELFGEEMWQAVDAVGVAASTLDSWRWVSTRLPKEERRPAVPWTHHREVAALDDRVKRFDILALAESEKLTSREVINMVKAAKAIAAMSEDEGPVEGKDPKTTESFSLTFTVPAGDRKAGLEIIETLEVLVRNELDRRGVELRKLSRTAS